MNDLFLRACRCEPVSRTPVWLMRQAGRYLPGYRALRAKVDFITLSRSTPDLIRQVTREPVDRFGMDAAILFADIMTPLLGAGVAVEFAPGPVVAEPFRSRDDLARLGSFDPAEAVPETLEAVRALHDELDVPLIGFAGGPFTLACYLVDGRGTKEFAATRALFYRDPEFLSDLLDRLADLTSRYLCAQIEAGAAAVQVFDTWAGLLAPDPYRTLVAPSLRRIFEEVRAAGVPSIYYVNGAGPLLGEIGSLGADVAGIDWRTPLDAARAALPGMAVQGNLDPMALLGRPDALRHAVRDVIRRAGGAPGHVFNLGHGIHRDTPPSNVELLVRTVAEESRR